MANLFSIFNPSISSAGIHLNWISSILVIFLLPQYYWVTFSQMMKLIHTSMITLHMEFSALMGKMQTPGISMLLLASCLFILLNNSLGLAPYVFTSSAHLSFTMSLAFTSWVGYFIMALSKSLFSLLAHLTPLGTPYGLMPFMVLIELVSSVIRPLTLSVRLAANMVAGHLLLVLASSPLQDVSISMAVLIMIGLMGLSLLEMGVAMIQAYVYSVLSSLYITEVNIAQMNYNKVKMFTFID